MIIHITDPKQKAAIAAAILYALPEWFGIPESTENYISESKDLPFFACVEENIPIGFMTLRETLSSHRWNPCLRCIEELP